jgi:hypothetical protein
LTTPSETTTVPLLKKAYLVFLALTVATVAFAAKPKVPSETELKSMTLDALLTFNKGVQAKDFTGFYKEIAKLWQEQTSPEKLQALFQDFIDKGLDISPIKKLEPVFNKPAVVFRLQYMQEEGEWKLVGIKLDTTD